MKSWLFAAIFLAASAPAAAQSQSNKLVVPAFFPVGDPENGWARIQAAGGAVQAVVAETMWPLQGSGHDAAQYQFDLNRGVGQLVLGYVNTSSGNRALTGSGSVEEEVGEWYGSAAPTYPGYAGHINGIFYDVGPYFLAGNGNNTPIAQQDGFFRNTYYGPLYSFTRGYTSPTPSPDGYATVYLNASQYPYEWILSDPAATIMNEVEIPAAHYLTTSCGGYGANSDQTNSDPNCTCLTPPCWVPAPSWWANYGGSVGRAAHVVYAATSSQITSIVNASRDRGAPALYIYDPIYYTGNPTPQTDYFALACYFEAEVAAATNSTSVVAKDRCPQSPSGTCVDLSSDVSNCGACGTSCSFANAGASCSSGSCAFGSCNAGYGNCDGISGNGCETNLTNNASNCGACGAGCSFPNAGASCVSSTCTLGQCNQGYANCDGVGSNGCEVNLTNDPSHCGSCGNACSFPNASATCASSTCGMGQCNTGYLNCDGNNANGCEINGSDDLHNCGSCGHSCPNTPNGEPTCINSRCGFQCNPGYRWCETFGCRTVCP